MSEANPKRQRRPVVERPLRDSDTESEDEDHHPNKRVRHAVASSRSQSTRDEGGDESVDAATDNADHDDDDDGNVVPREAGQIDKVYVENFMCHRKFTMNFGRNLNFVTGKNGSGKSAIVAAIQLCLGSTSRQTGRNSNLGGFIREGSPGPAIVRLYIHNKGVDAFEPENYGDKIVVERKIAKSGSASYELSALRGGKIVPVSKDKRDLEAMLRNFNIHIDNPCCVLTQEESKKFISGDEHEKYIFFLKATGLEMTKAELKAAKVLLREAEEKTAKCVENLALKKADMKKHREDVRRWDSLKDLEGKIRTINAKILWRKVAEAEANVDKISAVRDESIDALEAAKKALEDLRTATERSIEFQATEASIIELTQTREQVESDLSKKQQELGKVQAELDKGKRNLGRLQSGLEEHSRRVKDVTSEIREMQAKAKQGATGDERALRERLEELSGTFSELADAETRSRAELVKINEDMSRANLDKRQLESRISSFQRAIEETKREIAGYEKDGSSRGNASAFGGPNVIKLLDEIDRGRQRGAFVGPVFGPLGMHFKVKQDCKSMGEAIERVAGPQLGNFLVFDTRDQSTLNSMMKSCGHERPIIRMVQAKPYDVPTIPNCTTVLSALIIDEPLIFNCLIDQLHIENIIIVLNDDKRSLQPYMTRDERGREMFRDGITQAVTHNGIVVTYRFGNQNTVGSHFAYRRLLSQDVSEIIEGLKQSIQEKQMELQGAFADLKSVDEFRRGVEQNKRHHDERLRNARTQASALTKERSQIQAELDELADAESIDTSALETELQELQEAVRQITAQIDDLKQNQQLMLARQMREVKEQLSSLNNRFEGINAEIRAKEDELRQFLKERDMHKRRLAHEEEKVKKLKREVDANEERVAEAVAILEAKTEEARTDTPKFIEDWNGEPIAISDKENVDKLSKDKTYCERELVFNRDEVLKQTAGGSAEEAVALFEKSHADYKESAAQYESFLYNKESLIEDLEKRTEHWAAQLTRCTEVVRKKFNYYLNQKGFSGTAKFDHKEKTLTLISQTDSNNKLTQSKDMRQLSGGERSYTTLALLLSLGHVIETPFRLMDEYDVFLDEASRQTTLDSIQRHALMPEHQNTQFFVLTPHKLSNVTSRKQVRLQQMPDPTRLSASGPQQQTLNM